MAYRRDHQQGTWAFAARVAALMVVATSLAWAGEGSISVTSLEAMLKQNPLQAGGPTAKVAGSSRAGNSELQVIEMSKIKFHHHDQEDHIVYVARGRGILRMGEKGQETREVKPGDILNLPRGVPHGFEKQGEENLVLLVVATAGWKPLEDTKFYE
jgi:mannose-6-phosphate isomerase-like protein (cupin superfamily)